MNYPTRTRPLGITIIALLMGLFAILGICGSLTAFGFAPFAVFNDGGLGAVFSNGFGAIVGLIVSVANLLLAIGLWTLRPWAFWATVIVEVLSLLNAGYFFVGRVGVPRPGFGIHIIPLLVLLYLFLDGNVRRAFRT